MTYILSKDSEIHFSKYSTSCHYVDLNSEISNEHCLRGIFVMALNPTIHRQKMVRSHHEEQMCCLLVMKLNKRRLLAGV